MVSFKFLQKLSSCKLLVVGFFFLSGHAWILKAELYNTLPQILKVFLELTEKLSFRNQKRRLINTKN